MSNWSSGYVVDVTYTHGFYSELAPSYLSFATMSKGFGAPGGEGEPLTYCELGCGQGRTANLLAGANPQVEFFANDFNPAHIAGARALARAAGVSNVHFFDDSFEEFIHNPGLPPFDIIALHGIYSWISEENRRFIVRFIREKLKPGGAVYISYNAMPGWAPLMPLRHVLAEHAAGQGSGNILKKIGNAVAFAQRLDDAKAKYFATNPKAATQAKDLANRNRSYLAHEYFNRDFHAFYFADIAREMADAKLSWVGTTGVLDSIPALFLTTEQQQLLEEIDHVGLRETVRDHILDQMFRRDVFVKGPVRLAKAAMNDRWLATRFALTARGSSMSRTIRGAGREIEMQAELFDPLVSALDRGPATLAELLGDPLIAAVGFERVCQALLLLVGQGSCRPCLPAKGEKERHAHAKLFNVAAAQRALEGEDSVYLGSGTIGSGIAIDRVSCLIWYARHSGVDARQFVWDALERTGQKLLRDGKSLDTKEEVLAGIDQSIASFDNTQAPVLANLGVA